MLARAVLICSWRRLRPFALANPLVAAVVLMIAVALPGLALLLGDRVSPSLSKALLEQAGVGEALTAGIVLGGALAGVIVTTVAPGAAVFGPQISAAPVRRMRLLWAGAGLPLSLAAFVFATLLAFAAFPVAARLPAGGLFVLEIVAIALCASVLGASAIESGLAAIRGRPTGIIALSSIASVWIISAGLSESRVLGPFALGANSLRTGSSHAGRESALHSGVLAFLMLAAFFAWLFLSAGRAPSRARSEPKTVLKGVPRNLFAAGVVVALKRLSRREEIRREIVPVTFLCCVTGPALLVFAPETPQIAVLGIVSFSEIAAVAVIALAAAGVDEEGRWLWKTAPAGDSSRLAGNALGAIVLALLVFIVAIAPSLALASRPLPLLVEFCGFACFILAVAAVSGTVVPWRSERLAEQIASYTACLVLVGVLWYLFGKVAAPLAAAGAPEPAIFAALGLTAVAASLGTSAALAGGSRS